jgi:hypothetical protein
MNSVLFPPSLLPEGIVILKIGQTVDKDGHKKKRAED